MVDSWPAETVKLKQDGITALLHHRTQDLETFPKVPLTTKALILVGSYHEALYRTYKEPTEIMVLVVDSKLAASGCAPTISY